MHRFRRRQLLAATTSIAVVSASLTAAACTPKPKDIQKALATYTQAIENHDLEAAAAATDSTAAQADLTASWDGLQAEKATVSVDSIDDNTNRDQPSAQLTYTWTLPKERSFSYTAQVAVVKTSGQWKIRWKPAVIHPDLGAQQHMELRLIDADRAPVLSSDGETLLAPGIQYRVLLANKDAATVGKVAQILQAAHGSDSTVPTIDTNEVTSAAAAVNGPYSVVLLTPGQAAVADQLKGVDGVTVNEEPALVRQDPTFAPQLLRAVSSEVEDEVDGGVGWKVVSVNGSGGVISTLTSTDPQPASAIKVSLNAAVQRAAQDAVNTRPETEAMMVVVRPSTGEILAVAQTDKASEKGLPALSGQYPPGSTFKIITATAGITTHSVTPDSTVPCPGTMDIEGRVVRNYNSFSLGDTSLTRAFAKSCNTTFADMSYRLDKGVLADTAKQLGLGQDFTIDGLTTLTGSVPNGDTALDRTEAGYGQGKDLASPFGMALVAATVANGSTPIPVLIEGHATQTAFQVSPPSADVLAQVRTLMRAVVTEGTGMAVRNDGEIYAKTGEAEFNGGSHAWFAGYRGDLAFATLIPGGGGSEHSVAITHQFFQKLGDAA